MRNAYMKESDQAECPVDNSLKNLCIKTLIKHSIYNTSLPIPNELHEAAKFVAYGLIIDHFLSGHPELITIDQTITQRALQKNVDLRAYMAESSLMLSRNSNLISHCFPGLVATKHSPNIKMLVNSSKLIFEDLLYLSHSLSGHLHLMISTLEDPNMQSCILRDEITLDHIHQWVELTNPSLTPFLIKTINMIAANTSLITLMQKREEKMDILIHAYKELGLHDFMSFIEALTPERLSIIDNYELSLQSITDTTCCLIKGNIDKLISAVENNYYPQMMDMDSILEIAIATNSQEFSSNLLP